MNTNEKRTYRMPQLERVALDHDISLALESSGSPMGDPESMFLGMDMLTSDPAGMQIL